MRTPDIEDAYVYTLVGTCIHNHIDGDIEGSLDSLYSAVDSSLCWGEFHVVDRVIQCIANTYSGYIASFDYKGREYDVKMYSALLDLSLAVLTLILPVPAEDYVFQNKQSFIAMCEELCRSLGISEEEIKDIMRGLDA